MGDVVAETTYLADRHLYLIPDDPSGLHQPGEPAEIESVLAFNEKYHLYSPKTASNESAKTASVCCNRFRTLAVLDDRTNDSFDDSTSETD